MVDVNEIRLEGSAGTKLAAFKINSEDVLSLRDCEEGIDSSF